MKPLSTRLSPASADRAPRISSPLLRELPSQPDNRPFGQRRLILLLAVCSSAGFVVMTATRSWPDIFLFRLIYQAHDGLYLPLKGFLWTAWFPWSLALWIPVATIVIYGATSWVTGADPMRRIQRRIILRLATVGASSRNPAATRGARWLARIAQTGQRLGLGTAYLYSVVDHARAEELDQIEGILLAGEKLTPAQISRALALIDADLLVGLTVRWKQQSTQLLHTIFDLALLSHIEQRQDGVVGQRITRVIAMLDRSGGFKALRNVGSTSASEYDLGTDMLRALREAQPPARYLNDINMRLALLDSWSASSAPGGPAAELPESPEHFVDIIQAATAFAFFNQPTLQWAAFAMEALDSIEILWMGLILSSRSTPHTNALAQAIERSRLRTCRHLIQHRWASGVPAMAVSLWPDQSHLFWSVEGDRLAAGVS